MIRLNEYVFEQLNISYNIFEANSELVEKAKTKEGWNVGAGGKTAWWKSAENLIKHFINDVKYGRENNIENNENQKESIYLKKKFGENYKAIIKQCYVICYKAYNKDAETILFNEVPFVIQLQSDSNKNSVKINNIYLRSNLKCLAEIRKVIIDNTENKDKADRICKDIHYGFGKSSGQDFEDRLVKSMQLVFLNDFVYNRKNSEILSQIYDNDISVISARNLFTKLKENKLNRFSKIFNAFISNDETLKKINKYNIDKYIFQAGGSFTNRNMEVNAINQIINPNSLEITYNGEQEFENILKRSGAIIADIIINTNGNDNDVKNIKKKYIDTFDGDNNLIFISVKKDKAQLSAINIMPPFYIKGNRTIFNEYNSFEDLKNSKSVSSNAFINLCDLFSSNINNDKEKIKNIIFNYYRQDEKNRQKGQKITKLLKENNEINKNNTIETINALIQNIIGGNYIYLNSDGHIKYIPYELQEVDNKKQLFFTVELGQEIVLNPKGIRLSGCSVKSTLGKNKIPFSLIFRTSDRVKDLPYRLFLSFLKPEILDNQMENNTKNSDENNIQTNINFIQELFGE